MFARSEFFPTRNSAKHCERRLLDVDEGGAVRASFVRLRGPLVASVTLLGFLSG
jgi:hypothetical protein